MNSINALGRIDLEPRDAQDVVSTLDQFLKDQNPDIRAETVTAIGHIGTKDESIILKIAELSEKDEFYDIRRRATFALAWLSPEKGTPALLKLLETEIEINSIRPDEEKDPGTICSIARALGKIGPEAKDAIPAMIDLLVRYGEDSSVVQSAAIALGGIGPAAKDSVPILLKLLEGGEFIGRTKERIETALQKIQN